MKNNKFDIPRCDFLDATEMRQQQETPRGITPLEKAMMDLGNGYRAWATNYLMGSAHGSL